MGDDYLWDGRGAPDPEVERLERLLAGFRADAASAGGERRDATTSSRVRRRRTIALVTATTAFAAAAGIVLALRPAGVVPPPAMTWRVESLAGVPTCAGTDCATRGGLGVGEWLETDTTSRARLAVADLGEMAVAPGTRLRLAASGETGHRLELRRGEIAARVVAPPRLFVVDTPSATAVDLGCAYSLHVDDDGSTRLEVTWGWVSLETPGRGIL